MYIIVATLVVDVSLTATLKLSKSHFLTEQKACLLSTNLVVPEPEAYYDR